MERLAENNLCGVGVRGEKSSLLGGLLSFFICWAAAGKATQRRVKTVMAVFNLNSNFVN